MSSKFHIGCLLVVAALFLGACGSGEDSGATSPSQTETSPSTETEPEGQSGSDEGTAVRAGKVEIVDFSYRPDPITIEAGGKVIWVNRDSEPHTATAEDGSFDTGTIEEGKLKSESFKEPGTYAYICSLHPEMEGTVEVVE
jgi:plastocyanin